MLHNGLNDYQIDAQSNGQFAPPFARSLTRSAALIRSLARSLTHSGAHGKVVFVFEMNASISYHFYSQCAGLTVDREGG